MDVQQLRNFSLVAKMGNITRAAEVMHVSQPNLSTSIKRLESELDVQLFDRKKGHIYLTPIGECFLEYVDRCLSELDAGITRLHSVYRISQKKIMIAATDSSFLIPLFGKLDIIGPFNSEANGSLLHGEVIESEKLFSSLLNDEIDLAIGANDNLPDAVGWEYIYTEHIGILCSNAHPLCAKSAVTLEDVRNENFILNFNQYPKSFMARVFINAGYVPHIICESSENAMIGPMVAGNIGISLVNVDAAEVFRVRNSSAPVTLIPFKENITHDIGVIYRPNKPLPVPIEDIRSAYISYFTNP